MSEDTEIYLDVLNAGGVPAFYRPKAALDAPTPIYDDLRDEGYPLEWVVPA